MLRHEIRPGRLVAGLAVLGAAVAYAGDAAGSWHTPWYAVFPVVFGGLFLASFVAAADYLIRRRRSARRASRESTGAPASTSGSQAIR
ncbi:hypothetical protein GA0115259_105979 [Streptomyces sp. MnatMP-M17]|nr:hypothetical protein [Streptomyces sp. MnatMP-M17]SCF97004.1 hypothetical protein GA0115259_105979 [Streptomyces sp. MnatMP-M17]